MTTQCILIIDDDEVDRKTICRALAHAKWKGEIIQAEDAAEAHHQIGARRFDCILLDYNIPGTDGLTLLSQLLNMLEVQTPVVMLTGEGNEMIAVEAMKRGASDYLPKDILAPDTLLRVIIKAIEKQQLQCELAKARAQLEHMALYDDLTGLGNRSLYMRDLERTIARAQRHGASFYLLMMDLDRFKAANDTYGHEAGDVILAEVGRRLADIGRASDLFYRLGGDEFTAIIDAPDQAIVLPIVQRIIESIVKPIEFHCQIISIGISIGVAIYPKNGTSPDELLHVADAAMYQAKRSDKNVAFAGELQ